MQIKFKTKRIFIRVVTYCIAFLVALSSFAIYQYRSAVVFERESDHSYRQSLGDLSSALTGMDGCMVKLTYTSSPTQIVSLATKISTYAGAANLAMSNLPMDKLKLDKVSSFISQVSGYTSALSKSAAAGLSPTTDQFETLRELSSYSTLISGVVTDLNAALQDGDLSSYRVADLFSSSSVQNAYAVKAMSTLPEFNNVFTELDREFENYPKLIYDGPFSEHLLNTEPVFLKSMGQVDFDQAKKYVASLFGKNEDEVSSLGESDGTIPVYFAGFDNTICEISKAGGYPVSIRVNRDVGENKIQDSASTFASAFLKKIGLTSMQESYHLIEDNVMVINYAYLDQNVMCYPDLVKVGVALDNGEIVSFEASGFLYNHKNRGAALSPLKTSEICAKEVNGELTITSSKLCVMPTEGKNEVLCYEYLCQSPSFETFLVYVNANTGQTENILILEKSDQGELTV